MVEFCEGYEAAGALIAGAITANTILYDSSDFLVRISRRPRWKLAMVEKNLSMLIG